MLALALVLAALQQPAAAAALPPQVGDTSPFRRLVLPAPSLLRAGSGAPGPRYWQQRADYTIRASLDTATHTIAAAETELAYRFEVPEHGSDRMGREQLPAGWLYEIAQWYPRVAVYDDVRGWNTEQYLGQGEFYLEYGDFDVAITVPRGFLVAATGTLLNPLEVLTATQRARLARAVRSDTTIAIVSKAEVGQRSEERRVGKECRSR